MSFLRKQESRNSSHYWTHRNCEGRDKQEEVGYKIMTRRLEALDRICQGFGVAILYVFGSQAQKVRNWVEEQSDQLPVDFSDVDIGIKGQPGRTFSVTDKVNLSIALEDLFRSKRVDLIVLPEADPFLAAEIIRGERLFVRDEHEADEYDLYILRRAGDLAPLERERIALILGETT